MKDMLWKNYCACQCLLYQAKLIIHHAVKQWQKLMFKIYHVQINPEYIIHYRLIHSALIVILKFKAPVILI